MPLIYQSMIYRADLRANPAAFYVFGDNMKRLGMGGQAGQMRNENNAIGIPTKWSPDTNPAAYFSDRTIVDARETIVKDLRLVMDKLRAGRVVVWPLDGIGTGLSELPQRAPETWAWFERVRKHMEHIRGNGE